VTQQVEAGSLAALERASPLEELAESHYPWVLRMCISIAGNADQGEELAQEVMALACKHFTRLHDPQAFRPWLRAVARHTFIDWLRRGKREQEAALTTSIVPVTGAETGGGRDLDLDQAVVSLPPDQRTALVLHYFLGLRYREIAGVMSCPVGTVMSRLAAARSKLQRLLAEQADGGEAQ
jgi:RNA polymerase sigma-70 factor (ECF subfamily)